MKKKIYILMIIAILLFALSACNDNNTSTAVPVIENIEAPKINSTFLNTFRGKLNLLTSYDDLFWTIDDTKPEKLDAEKPNNNTGASNNSKPQPITNNDTPVDNGVVLIGGKRYRVVYHPAVTETIYHPEETITKTNYRQEPRMFTHDGTDVTGWSSAQIEDYCFTHNCGWYTTMVNVPYTETIVVPAWTETVVVQEAWTEYVPV